MASGTAQQQQSGAAEHFAIGATEDVPIVEAAFGCGKSGAAQHFGIGATEHVPIVEAGQTGECELPLESDAVGPPSKKAKLRGSDTAYPEEPLQYLDLLAKVQVVPRSDIVVPNGVVGNWLVPEGAFEEWTASFTLPSLKHKCERLRSLHPLIRDDRIVFDETEHRYTVNGLTVPISVTRFLAHFHEEFDADAAIAKMMQGVLWPQRLAEEFTHANGDEWTPSEIKAMWRRNGLEARGRGTLMHWHIEQHLNGQTVGSPRSPEFLMFQAFEAEYLVPNSIRPLRTELSIFHCGLGIAGQIDFIGVAPCGGLVIVDWKRTKRLRQDNRFCAMKDPLAALPDCNLVHYNLQLNMYRYILESEYGMHVVNMLLCLLHPTQETYKLIDVPRLDADIQAIVGYAQALCECKDPQEGPTAPFHVYPGLARMLE